MYEKALPQTKRKLPLIPTHRSHLTLLGLLFPLSWTLLLTAPLPGGGLPP